MIKFCIQRILRYHSGVHVPVLLDTVLQILQPQRGEHVLDATLGLGGHAEAFLEHIGQNGLLIGVDADENNLEHSRERLSAFSSQMKLIHGNFRDCAELIRDPFDVVFADLGVSSPHLDDPERGFSFRKDASLDMRYDRTQGHTAAQLIASAREKELANVLFTYGDVRASRKVARILKERLPKTTVELKSCVETVSGSVVPQVFQALRIEVNDEMGALQSLLKYAPTLLKPNGRVGIIAYHSLEDRMVKQAFKKLTSAERDLNTGADIQEAPYVLLTKKAVKPDSDEVERNPRSRSAKFRAIKRKDHIRH